MSRSPPSIVVSWWPWWSSYLRASLAADVARLSAENDRLRSELAKNSGNSSKPPSRDPAAERQRQADVSDVPAEAAEIHLGDVVDQRGLDLVEHRCRADRLAELVVERVEQKLAGDDQDQEVGVDDADTGRRNWYAEPRGRLVVRPGPGLASPVG